MVDDFDELDDWLYDDLEVEFKAFEAEVEAVTVKFRDLGSEAEVGANTRLLAEYSASVGDGVTEAVLKVVGSPTVRALPPRFFALFLRSRVQPLVERVWSIVQSLAFRVTSLFLKRSGFLFNAAVVPLPELRTRGVVGGSLNRFLGSELNEVEPDFDAGLNVLDSGVRQLIDEPVRSTLIKSSEKVAEVTGTLLEAYRIVTHNDACDFCISKAMIKAPLYSNSGILTGWHDFCRCRLVLVDDFDDGSDLSEFGVRDLNEVEAKSESELHREWLSTLSDEEFFENF